MSNLVNAFLLANALSGDIDPGLLAISEQFVEDHVNIPASSEDQAGYVKIAIDHAVSEYGDGIPYIYQIQKKYGGDLSAMTSEETLKTQMSLKIFGYSDAGDIAGIWSKSDNQAYQRFLTDPLDPVQRKFVFFLAHEAGVSLSVDGDFVVADPEAVGEFLDQNILPRIKSNLENIGLYREQFLSMFGNVRVEVEGLSSDDPAQAEGVKLNPEGQAFLMSYPDDRLNPGSEFHDYIYERAVWEASKDSLEDLGANIVIVEEDGRDTGRGVFTRDQALIIGDTAYFPDVSVKVKDANGKEGYMSTIGEVQQTIDSLEELGYSIVVVEGALFQGGNIIPHRGEGGNTLFVGNGLMAKNPSEDNPEYAEKLIRAINETQPEQWDLIDINVKPELRETFYHLDLALTKQLPNGEHLFFSGVTDDETARKIIDRIGEENVRLVSEEAARTYALNLNYVGDTIVTTAPSEEIETVLDGLGYNVITPDKYEMPTFEIGKGGIHCMTLELPALGS